MRDSASDSNYDSTDPYVTFSRADCQEYYSGFPNVKCLGSGSNNETARQRLGMVKFYDPVKRNVNLRFDSPRESLTTGGWAGCRYRYQCA